MKKRYTSKRRNTTFRRKRTTKRSSKYARRQQKAAMTWIRKKYTRTFLVNAPINEESGGYTISLIGTKNQQNPVSTITLSDVGQDGQLAADMRLYQFFRIRGVATKLFFPMPTEIAQSPVQWSMAYSASAVVQPIIPTDRMQTMASYQTGPCSQEKSVSRFYNTANAYRRFGIQYCSTSEFGNFNTASAVYGNQLQINQGSSQVVRVFRNLPPAQDPVVPTPLATLARLEVSYYVTYKGNKGGSSLTTVP